MNYSLTDDIQIAQVKKEHEEGIIDLISRSFSGKERENLRLRYGYLNYKNPIQNYSPIGLVAIHNNKIIGYRGFVGLPFVCRNSRIKILIPNSTATDINYRRKGISTKLNLDSLDIYSKEYSFFLGTSLNKLSVLGKLKLKWNLLGEKDYLYKRIFFLTKERNTQKKISFEERVPAKIIIDIFYNSFFASKLYIRIDLSSIDFVNWIFNRFGYKWAVLWQEMRPIAYCCFSIKNNECQLIHFDMIENNNSLKSILNAVALKYSIKTFYYYSINKNSPKNKILKQIGFWSTNIPFIRKVTNNKLQPILIRPTIRDFKSEYYCIDNIDTSNEINWDITKLSNF